MGKGGGGGGGGEFPSPGAKIQVPHPILKKNKYPSRFFGGYSIQTKN